MLCVLFSLVRRVLSLIRFNDVARVVERSLIVKSFNAAVRARNTHDFTFGLPAGTVPFHAIADFEITLCHWLLVTALRARYLKRFGRF